ncbi:MAG: transcription termination/antitermination NusG family protein [Chloroflexota bacterium]
MSTHWYALHSKPMKEDLLWEQLSLHQIESYYPRIRVKPVNPRSRKIKPYFPGYVFACVDLERTNLSVLQWMPGSTGIVAFDGTPATVPDNLIDAIRRRVDEINAAGGELFEGLKTGESVVIQGGPFSGYEAIFDARLSGDERVRVLLRLLNKQLPLELPSGQIQRKKP